MGFRIFRDRRYDNRIFRSTIIPCYIIPVFIMFASTFKRTHWLVPGYCLGQIALRGGMHRGDNLGAYVLTFAASRR